MADSTSNIPVQEQPKLPPELPKPERYLTSDEVIKFLGLRNKSALHYLMTQPDPPPFIRLTQRNRAFPLRAVMAWAEGRMTTNSK